MSNAVRFRDFKKKNTSKIIYSYALLVFSTFSMVLSGCSGFVTANSNNVPPSTLTVTNVQASTPTTSGFQVAWATNIAANSAVDYGTTASYGSTTAVDSSMVTNHQESLTNLTKGTLYHFRVRSTDAKGGSAASPDMTFATAGDVTPPTVSITSPAANATISGTTTVTADASDNVAVANVQFKVDNANTGVPVTTSPYSYSLNTTTLSNGNHILTAVATDTSGNATTSTGVAVKVNNTTTTVPSIASLSPTSGVVGTSVTVTGTNFGATQGTSTITFNGKAATPTSWSATSIVAPVPTGATTGNVVVTVGGVASNGVSFTVTTVPAPSITSLNPTSGLVGTSVTINGANFGATQGTSTVKFNGTAGIPTSWSASSIGVPVPPGATTGIVVVTVGGAASNGMAFTVTVPAPSITSLNPTSGLIGTSVTITGTNFGATQGTNTVRFNGTTASPTSWSATSMVAPVPAGATTGNVVVTISGVASNGVSFTVQADTTAPTVPTGLAATAVSSSQINLTWTASTDNVGVTGYNVYRGGTKIGTSASNSYQDGGLAASTSYMYTVSAFDAAGNTSAQSSSASATTQASGGGGIPNTLGWYQIPNTLMSAVCPPAASYPDIQAGQGCPAVISSWGGGWADTTRNRLMIWGGGHADYWGNELYALNLAANPITLTRLNEPTRFTSNAENCQGGHEWDGKPCSRHSYDYMAYSPTADVMINFGGSLPPGGSFCAEDIWRLNSSTLVWTSEGSGNWDCNSVYVGSAYDPNSQLIFFADDHNVFSYNTTTNTMTNAGGAYSARNTLAYSSVVVDPIHKYLFVMGGSGGGGTGGNLYRFNISNPASVPAPTDLLASSTGCSAWLGTTSGGSAPGGPGVAWDSVQSKIVMWNGGNSVGVYDPVANSCSTVTYPGGPGAAQTHGTYGRFSYFPALGVFALVNDVAQNAWTLRIDPASGGTGGPVISSIAASSITTSGATINWTTDVASTSQVEYGTTTSYGSSTTVNSNLVTSHSVALTGLSANTLYHFAVLSTNSGGTQSVSGDSAFQTSSGTSGTPPTVSITAPAANTTVSGTVTVSATATDSVGIASVQFLLDGANLGSPVTSQPYSVAWSTTGASNGAHSLAAQAVDTANNFGTSVAVPVTVSNSTTSADQNFQQRCASPGVLNCQGFDSASIFSTTASQSGFTDGFLGSQPMTNDNLDTSVYLSGGGSLRMTWPANYNSENCCKDYWGFFGQAGQNQVFGQNSTFYIQYAFRPDAAWVTRWVTDTYPKLSIIYNATNGSCGNMSLVTVNMHALNVPEMYVSCGGTPLETCSDGVTWNPNGCGSGEIYGQEGWTVASPFTGYECGYNGGAWSGPNCFNFTANTWYTIYYKVSVGTWGTPSSTVQAWIAPYGQQLRQWINTQNVSITPDNNGYNVIALTGYMTGHNGVNAASNVWFDELIISSQPIPAPAGQTPQ